MVENWFANFVVENCEHGQEEKEEKMSLGFEKCHARKKREIHLKEEEDRERKWVSVFVFRHNV